MLMLAKGSCIPAIRYLLVKAYLDKDIATARNLIATIKKTIGITFNSNFYCLQ